MIALAFPGQGSQTVGMGRDLAAASPAARAVFEEADDVLGWSVSEACFSGPPERLTATEVCQPALLATSIAAHRAAAEEGLVGDLVLGHSLGDYSALVAAGALTLAEGLRAVAERGAAMRDAGVATPGAMAALMGTSDADADALAAQAGVWIANWNCPGQSVASGSVEGIAHLLRLAGERGVRASRLAVSGAFHTPLVAPAAGRLEAALAACDPREPAPPFLSATTVRIEPAARLREVLLAQLTSPIRFGAAVEAALALGVTRVVEVGPGRILSGLVRRVSRDVATAQVGTASRRLVGGAIALGGDGPTSSRPPRTCTEEQT